MAHIPSRPQLAAFSRVVGDLLSTPQVQSMAAIRHHRTMTCYDHSLLVSYVSFRLARRWGWDYAAAARGGLLHDLYLYDGHDRGAHPGLQCLDHPEAAFRNASALTRLSEKEGNIILSHMWPAAVHFPRSREAWLVNAVDTLCAAVELSGLYRLLHLERHFPSRRCPPPPCAPALS